MKTESVPLALLFAGSLLAGSAQASWYPPGYEVETSCQDNGPVTVCAVNHHYGAFPRLHVSYRGYLRDKESGRISVWVKLNGRTGIFRLTPIAASEQVWLNKPVPYLCFVNPEGRLPEPYDAYKNCERTAEPQGSLVWEVEPVPAQEADLFFYARTADGVANAWDLELAFVGRQGAWDSQYGQNYRFRFE